MIIILLGILAFTILGSIMIYYFIKDYNISAYICDDSEILKQEYIKWQYNERARKLEELLKN